MEEHPIDWPRLLLGGFVLLAMAILAMAVNGAGPFAPRARPAPGSSPSRSVERIAQAPDIAGPWHDDHGYAYAFEQAGDRYSFRLFRRGGEVGGGSGRIDGHTLVHGFTSRAGAGSCTGTLDPAGAAITATCHRGRTMLAFRLVRGAGPSGSSSRP